MADLGKTFRFIQDSRSFFVNLYRSIHKIFDMLSGTNTTKGGWNHIWLIYPMFHYSNFPNVLWALRTVVSKTNKHTKQLHRFSALTVNYKIVSKTFYEWKWFIDRTIVCLQMFVDFPISITLIVVWKNGLLVNPVFREAAYSIILVRQPESRNIPWGWQVVNKGRDNCQRAPLTDLIH